MPFISFVRNRANIILLIKYKPLALSLLQVEETLNILADGVLQDQAPVKRKKMEQLITELVHQRDVTRQLIADKITSNKSFDWLCQMR